ncbi:hypothetical protein VTH82DRAFT_2583 [Thermothelomyces myriococcoides]
MLPTPSTSHVPYARVYEPAEDSFLLLDTLSSASETAFLAARFPSPLPSQQPPDSESRSAAPLVLEVGPGSGVVLAFLTAHAQVLFSRRDILTLGIDINRFACAATSETIAKAVEEAEAEADAKADATAGEAGQRSGGSADGDGDSGGKPPQPPPLPLQQGPRPRAQPRRVAGYHLGTAQGDLATAVRPGTVDVLVFNPPYVPTPELPVPPVAHQTAAAATTTTTTTNTASSSFEEDSRLLALSYAGGRDGMEVTDRLIAVLPEVLSPRGVAYLLLCAQNKPEEVKSRIRGLPGGPWRAETVGTSGRQAGWEKLQVVRIWRE